MSVVHIIDQSPEEGSQVQSIVESIGLQARVYSTARDFMDNGTVPERPGCIVFDFTGQGVDGIGLPGRLINQGQPAIPCILVSSGLSLPMAMRFVDDGAITALEKPYRESDLRVAITQAIKLDRKQYPIFVRFQELKTHASQLSGRERGVLDLMIQGKTTQEVAGELGIATRTVEACRKRAVTKFEARSTHMACVYSEYVTLEKVFDANSRDRQ